MKKRGLTLSLILICLLSLAACSSKEVTQDNTAQIEALQDDTLYAVQTDPIMGLTLTLPQKELADWTVLYGPFDQSVDRGEYAPIDGSYLSFMPMESSVNLFSIQYYDEAKWDGWMNAGHTADDITGSANSEEIGRKDNMVYVYSCPEPDETGMDSSTKEAYQRILNMLPTIRASITLITRGAANTGSFPCFSTSDLEGNPVDNTSFASYKLTMVNIWGTFCGPCIAEMPDLESLSKSMPKGTRLIGLITDALDDEYKTLAQKILSENGVTYQNWIPDNALTDYVNNYVTGVPTTLFIDANGQIIGDAIIGSQSVEDYMNALTSRLNEIGNTAPSGDMPLGDQPEESIQLPQQDNAPAQETKAPTQTQVAGPAPAV